MAVVIEVVVIVGFNVANVGVVVKSLASAVGEVEAVGSFVVGAKLTLGSLLVDGNELGLLLGELVGCMLTDGIKLGKRLGVNEGDPVGPKDGIFDRAALGT